MPGQLRRLETDSLTRTIISVAIEVHRHLGPGMLEHTYEVCFDAGLRKRSLDVQRQVPVPIRYLDVTLDCGYRMDMLVEGFIIVEVKAVTTLLPVHVSQLASYLRFSNLEVGLLFNFNVPTLVDGGWKRVLNDRRKG